MATKRSPGTGTLFKRTPQGSWIASWFDHAGRRRENTTSTTDRRAAERILQKHVADAALRKSGVVNAAQDRYSIESRRPIAEHVAAYVLHCRQAGQAPRHVDQKEQHLRRMIAGTEATRLTNLSADAFERHLAALKTSGLGARSLNFARQIAVAFLSWCTKTGRAESNPLRVVPKQDEDNDRRRERRALSSEELARLLTVARERGREAWYLLAVFAGLRKGDLQQLKWKDVDVDAGTITITGGKSKRLDVVPMHPQLVDAMRRHRADFPAMSSAKVFPATVTDRTRERDFLRAGIARLEPVLDAAGKPVLIGKGRHERPKMRVATEDEAGRVVDLHAFRTTLGTQLARAGVAPQIAQRIMRHGDHRTTLKHYTILGLTDAAGVIDALPGIGTEKEAETATGTDDSAAGGHQRQPQQQTPLHPRQSRRGAMRDRAASCERTVETVEPRSCATSSVMATSREPLREHAAPNNGAGDRDRTDDIQLGKRDRRTSPRLPRCFPDLEGSRERAESAVRPRPVVVGSCRLIPSHASAPTSPAPLGTSGLGWGAVSSAHGRMCPAAQIR